MLSFVVNGISSSFTKKYVHSFELFFFKSFRNADGEMEKMSGRRLSVNLNQFIEGTGLAYSVRWAVLDGMILK